MPSHRGSVLFRCWREVDGAIKPHLGIGVHQVFPAYGALVTVTALIISEEPAPPAHLFTVGEVDREGQCSAGIKGDGVCFWH